MQKDLNVQDTKQTSFALVTVKKTKKCFPNGNIKSLVIF